MAREADLWDELDTIMRPAFKGRVGRHQRGSSNWASKRSGFVGRVGGLVGQLNRTAKGAPQVMVKISGGAKGAKHMLSHLEYITRNSRLDAHDENGLPVGTREELLDVWGAWAMDLGKDRSNRRDTINMVYSMPAGTEPHLVLDATKDFAKKQFAGNHQYLLVLHNDRDHPHVHLTVKALGKDGRKLHPNKEDLQSWREGFARELRQQGIEAEATPRKARGIDKKGEKQVLRHLRDEGRARIDSEMRPRAEYRPWEERIAANKARAHSLYSRVASELERTGNFYDAVNAKEIRKFAERFEAKPMQKEREQQKGRARPTPER